MSRGIPFWQILFTCLDKNTIVTVILKQISWCKKLALFAVCVFSLVMLFLESVFSRLFCLPLTPLPLIPLPFPSRTLPFALFTPTLPFHQKKPVLNRNSLSVSVDLSWWQPQSTTESIVIPYGNMLSLALYPQPQFLFFFLSFFLKT